MKLALVGRSIQHSKSPELYKKIISPQVEYDLLDFKDESDLPTLEELSLHYDGINITAPYKEHYLDQVVIIDPVIRELKSINTISLSHGYEATNTDFLAIGKILANYQSQHSRLNVILLGSGAMARSTIFHLTSFGIPFIVKSRKANDDMTYLNLAEEVKKDTTTLVINTCSRDFVFQGTLTKDTLFWDFNYSFLPHQNSLPSLVKSYCDGQEMLQFQAEAAAQFWFLTNPKLKY